MKRILITGATGFIGNYVIQSLLGSDNNIVATSSNENKAKTFSWFPKVEYLPFDLSANTDSINLFEYFKKPDLVIHLAWEGLPNYKSNIHLEYNLPRQINFLTNLVGNGAVDITITGTCFEYGMREGRLSEDMPPHPENLYAIAKNRLREYLEELKTQVQFELKWTRLFYMYGRGQNPNSLFSQLELALESGATVFNMSGGEQVRDFLPVEKVAEFISRIALQNKVTGTINCCSGEPVTVKEFVEKFLKEKKSNIQLNLGYYPYPDYEPMSFWGDNSKLKNILNAD